MSKIRKIRMEFSNSEIQVFTKSHMPALTPISSNSPVTNSPVQALVHQTLVGLVAAVLNAILNAAYIRIKKDVL